MAAFSETTVRQNFPNVAGSNTPSVLATQDTLLPGTGYTSSVESQLEQSEISRTVPLDFINNPVQFQNSSLVCVNSSSGNSLENIGSRPTLNFGCSTNSSSTSTRLPSLAHHLPTSSFQRSLQNTTLSQFTPKSPPFISHAFHNLGPKILGPNVEMPQHGTRSNIPIRHVPAPRGLGPNSSLAESHPNP